MADTHEVASFDAQPFRITLTCECGKTFEHPNEDGAKRRHYTHAQIERVRAAGRRGAEGGS